VTGFWSAMCNAVSNLNVATGANMPWNLQRTKHDTSGDIMVNPMLLGDLAPSISHVAQISNSYDQGTIVEKQIEPPPWVASRYFTKDFVIQDANGNFQKATTAGISGTTAPSWGTHLNNITSDGAVIWKLIYQLAPATNPWFASSLKNVDDAVKDSNGRTQVCIQAGTTGTMAPVWPKTFGAKTKDATVVWQMMNPYVAAPHRIPDLPRYPYYWQNETLPRLMPPTNTSGLTIWGAYDQWQPVNKSGVDGHGNSLFDPGWQSRNPLGGAYGPADTLGMAYGWWIYSISLNRANYVIKTSPSLGPSGAILSADDIGLTGVSASDTGISDFGAGGTAATPGPGGGEVNVIIGCMCNGSFVPFGNYLTGQTVRVLWPIFTSDALVYQCSERVDIQALAIATTTTKSVSTNATITTPALIAAHINDTAQLLNLIT
jgi:hypothetical protein